MNSLFWKRWNGQKDVQDPGHAKESLRESPANCDDRDADLMVIDDSVDSTKPHLDRQDLGGSHTILQNASVQVNPDTSQRKRRNEDGNDLTQADMFSKKPRSPSNSSLASGPPPSGHGLGHRTSPEPVEPSPYFDHEESVQPPAELLRDLETRAITVSQLIQEVKGIYAGLVMVEKKCIEIVNQQVQSPTKLSKEQWQALIALHRTLLNEHHDFFSASHHPITEDHELRELAARYAMPARMWRHGIHAFLELLRHRLPDSLEHMLSFVYLAYSMMALLKETVPDFLETWIECLGDLARYRMAIEEADLRDREIWSNTARTWYNEAADLSPNTGRIQHHLAVLARPNIVQQLFLYSKALVAAIPFKNAGESILLLFNPLVDQSNQQSTRYQAAELNLVCAAAVAFKRRSVAEFKTFEEAFHANFQSHMARSGSRFKVQGPEIAGSLFAMLYDFGNLDNTLWSMINSHLQRTKQLYCEKYGKDSDKLPKDFVVQDTYIIEPIRSEIWTKPNQDVQLLLPSLQDQKTFSKSDDISSYVGPMLRKTISDVAGNIGNKNAVPFMHMVLAHLGALSYVPGALVYIERCLPWDGIVQFLNTVGRSGVSYDIVEANDFPKTFGGSNNKRQLPEDFVMRGLMALTWYYKPGFFELDQLVDEDERLLEQPSHQAPRVERCLWSAIQLTKLTDRWMSYDYTTKEFTAKFAQADD